jgi:hypothetical protein
MKTAESEMSRRRQFLNKLRSGQPQENQGSFEGTEASCVKTKPAT